MTIPARRFPCNKNCEVTTMIQPFSIPTILRAIPKPVLRQFFAKLGHPTLPIDWKNLREWETQPILRAISQMDSKHLMAVENALHQVFDVASDSGIAALREAGDKSFWLSMPGESDSYCHAMHAWLRHPEVFGRALLLQQVDHLGEWHTRTGLPKIAPQSTDDVLQRLATAMSDLLYRDRGFGRHCTVEHMRRADGTDYFLAYADDVPQVNLFHDENGNLARGVVRPALEIVFAYNREDRDLETFIRASPRLRTELEAIFCEIVLGDQVPRMPQRPAYNLNVLKEGPSRLITDPADGVVARVWQMRLALYNSRRHIVLEADHGGSREDIYAMLDECLDRQHLPLSVLNVTAAELNFDFQAVNGRQSEAITFDLIYPDLCTLRNQRPDCVVVVRKYLRQWRIAVD